MGGTQAGVDETKNYSRADLELNNIEFLVDFSNIDLQKSTDFYNTLYKEVATYFRKNNVTFTRIDWDGKGGGTESMMDVLSDLWSNRQYFTILIHILRMIKGRWINYLTTYKSSIGPRVDMFFSIETGADFNKISTEVLNWLLSRKLTNLILLSNSVTEYIYKNHNYLICNFSIELKAEKTHYSINFSIPHEFRNKKSISRYLRIIRKLQTKPSCSFQYNFTNWYAIRRSGQFTGDNVFRTLRDHYYFF